MNRDILNASQIHDMIRERIANYHADILREVKTAIAGNKVVVVGMAQNPFPKKARRILNDNGIEHKYLEYGSYFSTWKRRNAIKMWSGWPTFPMIFVKGVLIGGASELKRLSDSGELTRMLGDN
ncbi:MAG: glutaredoxin [Betaproteobacteria bacterium]|nr:glutaredoxin [Betaproteobacteria bacterium]